MTDQTNGQHEDQSFEARLEALEEVVAALESGDLSLDDMIRRYEQGMELVASCQRQLAEAELRVTRIAAAADDPDQ